MTCPNLQHYSASFPLEDIHSDNNSNSSADPFSDDSNDDFNPSLVSENSSSDIEMQKVIHDRKKITNYKAQNKKQKRQQSLRNSGYSYTSLCNPTRKIKEKCLRTGCGENCRFKCKEKITEYSRFKIFQTYWDTSDLQRQREFISSHIKPITPKYRYSSTQNYRSFNNAFFWKWTPNLFECAKHFLRQLSI